MAAEQEFDSPWKDALSRFFEAFVRLVAPDVHQAIDWAKGVTFLEKELRKITRDAALGKGEADLLARVYLAGGGDAWIFAHVEAQSHRERRFSERMFLYYVRITAQYRRPVLSLALLTDDDPDWRPDRYDATVLGSGAHFRFHVVKLLDYRGRETELEANDSPIALVFLAHLRALETGADRERLAYKIGLVRLLLDRGFPAEIVYDLFRIIDWLIALPKSLQDDFDEEADQIERERHVTFITSRERKAMARGRREDILKVLEARFGPVPDSISEALEAIYDETVLGDLVPHAVLAKDLDEFSRQLDR